MIPEDSIPEGAVIRRAVLIETMDYRLWPDGREERLTYDHRGRWHRTVVERTGKRTSCVYHVRVAGRRLRVPWLAWGLFSRAET